MPRFRKIIEVEAFQFYPTSLPWPEGIEGYQSEVVQTLAGDVHAWNAWRIQTLEGPMEVRPGDWIITGVQGERYPCKPDIFEQTYEAIIDTPFDLPITIFTGDHDGRD